MKLVILSDSHGDAAAVRDVMRREAGADAMIFLGDGVRDAERWHEANPGSRVYIVRGNCDFGSEYPLEGVAAFGGVLFFYTHGHAYSVKLTLGLLAEAAQRAGAAVALFGHTHCPLDETEGGVRLFNPGCVSGGWDGEAGYGIIEVENGELLRVEHRVLP